MISLLQISTEQLFFVIWAFFAGTIIALLIALWRFSDRITDRFDDKLGDLIRVISSIAQELAGLKELVRMQMVQSQQQDPRFILPKSQVRGNASVYAIDNYLKVSILFDLDRQPQQVALAKAIEAFQPSIASHQFGMFGIDFIVRSNDAKEAGKIARQFLHYLDEQVAAEMNRRQSISEEFDRTFSSGT